MPGRNGPTLTSVIVENEGAHLQCWYQGSGPTLLILIQGGGNGQRFHRCMSFLSRCREQYSEDARQYDYTVATYDRRGNGASIITATTRDSDKHRPLNPSQSARDVVAIMQALGYSEACLFGSSSGGIIALQVAAMYPERIEAVVVHETPTLSLLGGAEGARRLDDAYAVLATYVREGPEAALATFRASVNDGATDTAQGAGDHDTAESDGGDSVEHHRCEHRQQPPAAPPTAGSTSSSPAHPLEYFFRNEFLVLNLYTPPFEDVRMSGVPVTTVEGKESQGVFHARVTGTQARLMACHHAIWSGGHTPFESDPEIFAQELHQTLMRMGVRKVAKDVRE